MASDRQALIQLRIQARQARASGHYLTAARLEDQAVELAKTLHLTRERMQALLWRGYSLWQAGEDDLALAALLQVAGARTAATDPADLFNALTAILHISLERKSARFCRALLDQGRCYLADLRRPWTAPLDFLEGELAYRRGDFTAAWDWHRRAWASWRDEYPRLTPATHLWALCRVAFRRRATADLAQFTEELVALHPAQLLEQQLVQRARLLLWRARRVTDASRTTDESALVEIAPALLPPTTASISRDSNGQREALRVLMLARRWTVTADTALAQYSPDSEHFDSLLLLGDLALHQVRTGLGLPIVDDDYGERNTGVSAPLSTMTAAASWHQAHDYYQAALSLAAIEDERLETDWYRKTIQERQNRCESVVHSSL